MQRTEHRPQLQHAKESLGAVAGGMLKDYTVYHRWHAVPLHMLFQKTIHPHNAQLDDTLVKAARGVPHLHDDSGLSPAGAPA